MSQNDPLLHVSGAVKMAIVGAAAVGVAGIVYGLKSLFVGPQSQDIRIGDNKSGLVCGKWAIVTEEGKDNVLVYYFEDKEEATTLFHERNVSRILYDPEGKEVDHMGIFPSAFDTIRRCVAERTGWLPYPYPHP